MFNIVLEDIECMNECVCRAAPALPGMLKHYILCGLKLNNRHFAGSLQ